MQLASLSLLASPLPPLVPSFAPFPPPPPPLPLSSFPPSSLPTLQLKSLGIDNIMRFDWLAPPAPDTMVRSLETLFAIGALDSDACLTRPLGLQLAEIPLVRQDCIALHCIVLYSQCTELYATVWYCMVLYLLCSMGLSGRNRTVPLSLYGVMPACMAWC